MFSSSAGYITNLIDYSFIAGIEIDSIDKSDLTKTYPPVCLLGYPSNDEQFHSLAELIYPLNANVLPEKSSDDYVNFFTTILTDEKAQHSYLYVLKMYELIDNIKVPIAICFASKINDTDAFKQLLNEIYLILSSQYSQSTKQVELMNYFMFVHSIIVPPYHTLMTLKMRYMPVDFYFHSLCEIPCTLHDTSIDILFRVLDVNTIIILWLNVLRENSIIIYGNKPYLLNAICDALTRLIFPFKWLHTYISCLAKSQLDLIESPCPFIIGVLSSIIDIKTLHDKDRFEACIVDLETGQIIGKKSGKLPREEDILLKKKLQYIKNPELFEEHELFKSEMKNLEFRDVIKNNLSFTGNIQRFFFHIIKKDMKNYQSYMNEKSIIEEKRFLNSIQSPEMKTIWERIIKSNMFDHFAQLSNHKDDSYNRIFNELCQKKKNDIRNSSNAYKIEIVMPVINEKNISKLLKEMKYEDAEFERIIIQYYSETKQSDFLLSARKLSTTSLSPCKYDSCTNFNFCNQKEDSCLSCSSSNNNDDFVLVDYNGLAKKTSFNLISEFQDTEVKNNPPMPSPFILCQKAKPYINTAPKIAGSNFRFYSEDGFIGFMKKMIEKFTNKKYTLIDLFIRKDFMTEIINSSIKLTDTYSSNQVKKIVEENEGDEGTPTISLKKDLYTQNQLSNTKSNNKIPRDSFKSLKLDDDQIQIIRMNLNDDNYQQKYLFYAFYLEDILKHNPNGFNNYNYEEIHDKMICLYHKALEINPKEPKDFPDYRYSALISTLTQEQLKHYESDNRLSHVRKVIQEAINAQFQKLRSSSEGKGKLKKNYETPIVKHKGSVLTPNQNSKCLGNTICFKNIDSPDQSPNINTKRSLKQSHTPLFMQTETDGELINFAIISKQMKKEINDKKQSKKKTKEKGQDYYMNTASDVLINKKHSNLGIITEFSLIENIECYFKTPQILNKQKKVMKSSEPISLIISIGNKIINFISLLNKVEISFISGTIKDSLKDEFQQIQNMINNLQRVNLAKFPKSGDQYTFWLNCFNFLLIFAILSTNFQPKTFEDWGLLLKNCLYKIGGYEISLYEIENKIMNCCNFHNEVIQFTDSITAKFCIVDENILINLGLHFPIKSNLLKLKVYTSENIEEELYKNAIAFFENNIQLDKEHNKITMSKYLQTIIPSFLENKYEQYQPYINKDLYCFLADKINQYTIDYEEVLWEYSLSSDSY